MLRLLLALGLVALAACRPADGETSEELQKIDQPHDANADKESNYKKFMGEKTFSLPFTTRISTAFTDGQTIHFVGKLKEEPHRVDFNFQKGRGKGVDLPLHFSIRFDEGLLSSKFVYNTFLNGNWSEDEKRISNPFKAGQDFDLRVRIKEGFYYVYADRKDVGKFKMDQSLDGIDHVSIRGDITNLTLFHYGGSIFPPQYTAITNLLPGKRLDISGIPTGKRFNVNLFRENKEYALQLSFRMGEGAIVRNAMSNGVWGTEEREGGLPINKFEIFDLTVINEEFSVQIFLNGKRFATFAHRGRPDDIKTILIDGDVDVHTITINDALGKTSH